jgi:hypothetical protein
MICQFSDYKAQNIDIPIICKDSALEFYIPDNGIFHIIEAEQFGGRASYSYKDITDRVPFPATIEISIPEQESSKILELIRFGRNAHMSEDEYEAWNWALEIEMKVEFPYDYIRDLSTRANEMFRRS